MDKLWVGYEQFEKSQVQDWPQGVVKPLDLKGSRESRAVESVIGVLFLVWGVSKGI